MNGFSSEMQNLSFSIKLTANILKNTKIDFMGKRKIFYGISIAITIIGIASLFIRGLNPGIDFTGGRTYVVRFDEPVTTGEVAQNLAGVFGEPPLVVTYGSENQVRITTKYRINETGTEVNNEVETALYEGLKGMVGSDVTREKFLSDYSVSSETVGPTIASNIKRQAIWAVALSLVMIFFYIFLSGSVTGNMVSAPLWPWLTIQ